MTAQPANISAFIDAARDSLAREIAVARREAQRERETFAAEMRAVRAEWEARLASVAEVERRLADRVATIKDGEPGRDGKDGRDGASVTADEILPALIERADAAAAERAEAILERWEKPKDGADGLPGEKGERGADGAPGVSPTAAEVAALVVDVVTLAALEAVAAIPAPKDGKDGADGRPGERGADGTSVTADDIAPMVRAEVGSILAGWERPQAGKSVTADDLAPVVEECVQRAVSAIPAPKDGAPGERGADGKSVTAADIEPMLREMVAAIPVPKDGAPGERGPEGPAGKLPVVKEWADGVFYEGEVVTRHGGVYQALRDTGKEPGHEDWRCIVERGRDGADGRALTLCGTYSENEAYRALDVVALNGASFAAKRDDPGACPGDGWQLLAMQGKAGKPGPKGDRGERGSVVTASVVGGEFTDGGVFIIRNADGSAVEIDAYHVLSKLGR